jgi:hypothetical protein
MHLEDIPQPFQLQTHQEPIHPPGSRKIKLYHEVKSDHKVD